MKKKSGHRRRTKIVRRSNKNLRRTIKRKRLGKGRRRPTRRYSRVQRGGENPEENYQKGLKYENGQGVDKNYSEAAKYYKLAADNGHADAGFKLGQMYENGQGVEKNVGYAYMLYQIAKRSGLDDPQRDELMVRLREIKPSLGNGDSEKFEKKAKLKWLEIKGKI
jgi:TPR repeat protein